MNEAPKKIWIGETHGYWMTHPCFDSDTPYIRDDLVDAPVAWMHRLGEIVEVSLEQLPDEKASRGWYQEPLYRKQSPLAEFALKALETNNE